MNKHTKLYYKMKMGVPVNDKNIGKWKETVLGGYLCK